MSEVILEINGQKLAGLSEAEMVLTSGVGPSMENCRRVARNGWETVR